MTSKDIVDALAAREKISKMQAREMLVAVLGAVADGIVKGDVSVAGFGTFRVTRRPGWAGRNPRTGAPMLVAPSRQIRFRAAKALKDRAAGR